MPEMYFQVRWPDGREQECYSPSLVIKELVTVGQSYPVFEFVERCRAGLRIASERVRLKYGFYCSAAMEQLTAVETLAQTYEAEEPVQVIGFRER
jgi:uncharacterized repeat protein (TIGR04042 family)